VDYGAKRIGLAVSDPDATIASPLATVTAGSNLDACVRAVLDRACGFDIVAFVVGLPLNMNGTEGKQAEVTRRFGDRLAAVTGKPVHYWDERLTSVAAGDRLRSAELTRKKRKARLDRVAAQIILQEFLDAKGWLGC